jgi:hypothetical protein
MMAIYISDNDTIELVERLAQALGESKTMAIKEATSKLLEIKGLPVTVDVPKPRGGPKADLEARLHRETTEYVRLMQQVTRKKGGSRVYGMLKRHGPVETLRRLIVGGPSQGLQFLAENDRLDLAAETAATDPIYESLIPEELRERAKENLAYAEIIRLRKKDE